MANNHLDTSLFDKAVIFAVKAHQGTERRGKGFPYIIHPMEAAEIASTITDDQEILAAAILHDTVEDTPATIQMIREDFGERVASLVESESDVEIKGKTNEESWHARKQDSLKRLEAAPQDAKIVALSDKLSNMRAIARDYATLGDTIWNLFHVKDKSEHEWRFRALARCLSPLADTEAYKEFVSLINQVFDTAESEERPCLIDMDDYVESGEGYTAVTYNAKDGKTMVKLYKDFIPEEVPYREQRVVRTLVSMGVNTPDVGRIVTDGKRIGVEFQLISPKKSFARSIAEEPERIEEFAIRFAKAARKLHSTPCDTTVFGNVKDFFNQKITINKYFTDEEKKRIPFEVLDPLHIRCACDPHDVSVPFRDPADVLIRKLFEKSGNISATPKAWRKWRRLSSHSQPSTWYISAHSRIFLKNIGNTSTEYCSHEGRERPVTGYQGSSLCSPVGLIDVHNQHPPDRTCHGPCPYG